MEPPERGRRERRLPDHRLLHCCLSLGSAIEALSNNCADARARGCVRPSRFARKCDKMDFCSERVHLCAQLQIASNTAPSDNHLHLYCSIPNKAPCDSHSQTDLSEKVGNEQFEAFRGLCKVDLPKTR